MSISLQRLQNHLLRAVKPCHLAVGNITRVRCISKQQSPLSKSDIEPSRLKILKTSTPKELPALESLKFGHNFTDHMLTISWSLSHGWGTPEIKPYGPLSLDPSSTVFHYAQCLFEGLKAYRCKDGKITLFRPDLNMTRMNRSAQRLALPTFNGDALLDLIKQLVRLERHWIPQKEGHSLYIRPAMIGTQSTIGISPPDSALLFVICSPVGPYYPDGFKPVALHGTTEHVRAYPGGTGAYKIGANYAPAVLPQKEAAQLGYVQNLWLSGPEHHLTEVGTMNLFVVFRQEDGTLELVTPPLDGMILPGVTRDSLLSLARSHAAGTLHIPNLATRLTVSERGVTMKEVCEAAQSGRLVEMFGGGTAAIVSPINKIGYRGQSIDVPVEEDGMGPVSRPLWTELVGRQTGEIESDWSVVVYKEQAGQLSQ
ncbi:branched-chain amino acid aminotransferase II [Multifurca ochricompacta]|uniref:Branched-chain-amino-acid aminotransferase n=1 Tax=Multifurca ochricompacta TaxID=376703 RepID=A0AAD4MC25_9AGAM|nr:branched-chain amino acid aminotransferase II [Multifurca ochricompacta]